MSTHVVLDLSLVPCTWPWVQIPTDRHATTPVFLLATAGLRKLDAPLLNPLLASARAALSASPFRFNAHWARTITGEDEAVYGWLALNVFTGRLGDAAALAHAARKWGAVKPFTLTTTLSQRIAINDDNRRDRRGGGGGRGYTIA